MATTLMPARSLPADRPTSRAGRARDRLRNITGVVILTIAIFGGPPPARSDDLYDYFVQVGDDPTPAAPRSLPDPPRNELPTQHADQDTSAAPPAPPAAWEGFPLLVPPPRNAIPVAPEQPRALSNTEFPSVPPRNVLPGSSEPEAADNPPLVAPAERVPTGPPAGSEDLPIGCQPRRIVVLPQDLPMLTYMDCYGCRPAPPLGFPAGGMVGPPASGVRQWDAYLDWEMGPEVACADPALPCVPQGVPRWRAYGGGLVLVPDGGTDRRLSISTADPGGSLLSTGDAETTAGGVEFAVARLLAGGGGVEFKYWGLYPADQSAAAADPAPGGGLPDLATTLNLSTLDFDNGVVVQSVDGFFNAAQQHRLTRAYEVHNLELNLHFPLGATYGGGRSGWLGGIRYLDLQESLDFWTDPFNTVWGDDPTNELVYEIEVENRLVGVQLGVFFDHPWTAKVHLTGSAKSGLYNNDMKYHTRLGNIVAPAVVGGGVFAGQPFDVASRSDDVAYLGEAELGLAVDLSRQWQLGVGYKSVILTGVALAPDQIATNFNNLSESATIDSSGSLLLHGGYARLVRNW